MKDIRPYKTLCLLVSLTNDCDKSILANDLLNDCFSFYTNCLNKEDKREMLKIAYLLLNSKDNHLIEKLDIFKKANYNRNSLEQVLHILEINY